MGYPVDDFTLEERLGYVYDKLVDQTQNPKTYTDARKNFLLKNMLDLVEYLKGNGEDPMPEMFE